MGTIASILFLDILLGALVILSIGILVTVLTHLFTGVPYVPTPPAVVAAMIKAARIKGGETVVDLGAGDCRLLIAAKRAKPTIKAWGCELAPTIWLLGRLRILLSGKDVTLRFGDAFRQDVSKANVIFLYLMPEVLRRLEPRLDRKLKAGTRVVSHAFRFAKHEPVRTLKIPGLLRRKTVYVYEW